MGVGRRKYGMLREEISRRASGLPMISARSVPVWSGNNQHSTSFSSAGGNNGASVADAASISAAGGRTISLEFHRSATMGLAASEAASCTAIKEPNFLDSITKTESGQALDLDSFADQMLLFRLQIAGRRPIATAAGENVNEAGTQTDEQAKVLRFRISQLKDRLYILSTAHVAVRVFAVQPGAPPDPSAPPDPQTQAEESKDAVVVEPFQVQLGSAEEDERVFVLERPELAKAELLTRAKKEVPLSRARDVEVTAAWDVEVTAGADAEVLFLYESLGRVNWSREVGRDRKGFQVTETRVTGSGSRRPAVYSWHLCQDILEQGQFSSQGTTTRKAPRRGAEVSHWPFVYEARFTVPGAFEPASGRRSSRASVSPAPFPSYFLDLEVQNQKKATPSASSNAPSSNAQLSRGVVLLNGRILGRYFVQQGPQKKLYIPGSFLVGSPSPLGTSDENILQIVDLDPRVRFSNDDGLLKPPAFSLRLEPSAAAPDDVHLQVLHLQSGKIDAEPFDDYFVVQRAHRDHPIVSRRDIRRLLDHTSRLVFRLMEDHGAQGASPGLGWRRAYFRSRGRGGGPTLMSGTGCPAVGLVYVLALVVLRFSVVPVGRCAALVAGETDRRWRTPKF